MDSAARPSRCARTWPPTARMSSAGIGGTDRRVDRSAPRASRPPTARRVRPQEAHPRSARARRRPARHRRGAAGARRRSRPARACGVWTWSRVAFSSARAASEAAWSRSVSDSIELKAACSSSGPAAESETFGPMPIPGDAASGRRRSCHEQNPSRTPDRRSSAGPERRSPPTPPGLGVRTHSLRSGRRRAHRASTARADTAATYGRSAGAQVAHGTSASKRRTVSTKRAAGRACSPCHCAERVRCSRPDRSQLVVSGLGRSDTEQFGLDVAGLRGVAGDLLQVTLPRPQERRRRRGLRRSAPSDSTMGQSPVSPRSSTASSALSTALPRSMSTRTPSGEAARSIASLTPPRRCRVCALRDRRRPRSVAVSPAPSAAPVRRRRRPAGGCAKRRRSRPSRVHVSNAMAAASNSNAADVAPGSWWPALRSPR